MSDYVQGDLRFIIPPPGAVGLNEMTSRGFLPKNVKLTIVAETGAEPHTVDGRNFQLFIGKKIAGRREIAVLFAAEPIKIKYGKGEELELGNGTYYVQSTGSKAEIPLVA